jgi:hypothetical protein
MTPRTLREATGGTRTVPAGHAAPVDMSRQLCRALQITVQFDGHLPPGANKAAIDRLDDGTSSRNLSPTEPAGRHRVRRRSVL